MARIAIVLADDFEDSEFTVPYGNFLTSRKPADLEAFSAAIARRLIESPATADAAP